MDFQFSNMLFREFADTLERIARVKIYYSDKWVDSFYVDLRSESDSLQGVLNKALGRGGWSFIIRDSNKIILSKGYPIKTNFRDQYKELIADKEIETDTLRYAAPGINSDEVAEDNEYKLFRIGKPSGNPRSNFAVLSGVVLNSATGIPVAGAVVYIDRLKAGAITNESGYYSITLPKGQYQLESRILGMKPARRNFVIHSDGRLDIEMTEINNQLSEVVVFAKRENEVRNIKLGVDKISVKVLKQMPTGFGEADVIKSTLLLPGVQSAGEAASGYNVRGGGADQNLVLLNNAPIINSSHFFGFFSAFNSDLVRDVVLYKNGIPARFGGRISSVMDITPASGNDEKIKVSGGVSPVTCRLMVNGPVVRNKCNFIIGSRATYSDWIMHQLSDQTLKRSSAGFYDFQGMVNLGIDGKNSLSVSGYISNDEFLYFRQSGFDYGSLAGTMAWKHIFNQKLSARFSAIVSNYRYHLDMLQDSTNLSSIRYNLNQKILRTDFLYFANEKHRVEFGLDAVFYSSQPGIIYPQGDYSLVLPRQLERERALESSLYFSDEYDINPRLAVSAGVRATLFSAFGPGTEFVYSEGLPKSTGSITDTIYHSHGSVNASYPGLEFRLSGRLNLSPESSLKIGAQRVYQYLHMLSNTTTISPTDVWKLSDSYIKPEMGDQISLGYFYNFERSGIEASVETYYKRMLNILDYKGGAVLLMNEHLETDVLSGNGKAYGIEFMAKRQYGAVTGWVSYTYSRSLIRINGKYESERVNGGKYFSSDFDKPHDFKIISNIKFSRRFNASGVFVYNTGRPITLPVAFYDFTSQSWMYYSERNKYRIPDYIRVDLAATLNGNLKSRKINHSSFTLSVYNLLGRKNPYSVYFKNEGGVINGYRLSIFGQPVVMLTWNFRILGNASDDF